jgi:hypothetical protein
MLKMREDNEMAVLDKEKIDNIPCWFYYTN